MTQRRVTKKQRARIQGPFVRPIKEQITLRLDKAVLAHYQAAGPGWQTRLNADLATLVAQKGGTR